MLSLISFVLISCAEGEKSRYKDISHLEMPPEMEIAETEPVVVGEYEKLTNTGLGDDVSYTGSDESPVMKIKKLFDRSWVLLEQALKLSEIEITDKNREQGVFYVNFDPDARDSKDSELIDSVSFFFFEGDAAAYKLKVEWRETDTEVTAELVEQDNTDILDDDKGDFDESFDGGSKLLKRLYRTIRDDLPLD